MYIAHDLVGVILPLCEPREIIEDSFAVRMKNMGAKLMDENSALTEKIISISAYMVAHLKDQHFFTCSFHQLTRYNCACHAATDDKTVIHFSFFHVSLPYIQNFIKTQYLSVALSIFYLWPEIIATTNFFQDTH